MERDSLAAFLGAIPLPGLAIDRHDRIIAANPEGLTLIGGQAVGRNYVTMLRQPALLDAIEATQRDSAPRTARYLGNDGAQDTTFQVSVRAAGADHVIVTYRDVTQLEQAAQMRRDFVANVSHELRTPLTALMGFIETLRGPARDDAAARDRFLDIMQDEAARMNRLVGDLMSLNRVESDERVRPTQTVALDAVIATTVRTLTPLAHEVATTLEITGHAGPVPMTGDADQLTQVFTNLIENAIKYGGADGHVRIDVQCNPRDPAFRTPGVRVRIIDHGPGIAPVHLPRLTERFYRADDHRSRALGGTGLGLAIVKHIINRHRGRLRVHSVTGQGATFTVILPTHAHGDPA